MDGWDNLLTETKDTTGDGVAETTTTYTYDGTQQTGKTVWQGTDTSEATGKKLEQDSYSYNLQGRMASAEVKKYDSTGTLTEHTKSEYTYDDNGIRVSQTVSTDGNKDGDFADTIGSAPEDTVETTKYLNDANNPTGYSQVLEERVAEAIARSYLLGLDVISQAIADGTVQYLLYDGHGSTRMLVDATGAIISSPTAQVFRYDAFGNRLDTNTALTSLLYSGEQTDPTGLQYLRARYYDPATGRFNRLDPFAGNRLDPQSLHKYLYCIGDGINRTDPSGRFSAISCGISVGIMSGLAGMAIGAVHGAIQGYKDGGVFGAITQGASDAVVYGLVGAVSGFIVGVTGYAGGWLLSHGAAYFLGINLPIKIAVLGVLRTFQVIFTLEAAYELAVAKDEADAAAAFTAIVLSVGGPKLVEKIPFWPAGGSWRAAQCRLNKFIGRVGEDVQILRYIRAGWEIVGRQISFRNANGEEIIADAVVRDPQTGRLRVLDAKTGNGTTERAQPQVYSDIAKGNAEPFGGNAEAAGLTAADFPAGTEVYVERFGAWWEVADITMY